MNKSTGIILAVAVLLFGGLFTWAIIRNQSSAGQYSQYDANSIISANDDNGHIADHIEGNEDAEILLVEYADFQCSGCAANASAVTELVEKYAGKVAVIHRSYVLSYHSNGIAAASAAEAAGLQGYWKAYGDYLFKNQSEWYYSDANTRTEQFVDYFDTVTNGKGDKEKFLADMGSAEVKAKVNFDIALAKTVSDQIEYTPAFFLDGKFIDWAYDNPDGLTLVEYMSKLIDEKLDK